jgi:hypothetical protein
VDSVGDTVVLAEDIPLLHRAGETSAVAARSPRLPVSSMEAFAEAGSFTGDARIMAAGDIMAQGLASVSMPRMDMPRRCAIPQDSMTSMACGKSIQAAPFLTATERCALRSF